MSRDIVMQSSIWKF